MRGINIVILMTVYTEDMKLNKVVIMLMRYKYKI